jgi:protein-tyrosine phosphatase
MPIRRELKTFWWFIDGRIGGMGRPGFNQCHWYDLSLEEGILLSWLGKQHQTAPALESLWQHLKVYGPKVAPFYDLSAAEVHSRLCYLRHRDTLLSVVDSLNAKAGIFQEVTWQDHGTHATLHFLPNVRRLQHELALLRHYDVSVVISLLEQPLNQTVLEAYFEVYHLPLEDVTPPSYEQVYAFADILHTTLAAGKNVVTHCLAGVGRTTTMLVAAYLVQGYRWDELVAWVRARNPHFQFKGNQVAFLQELAHDIAHGRLPLLPAAKETCQCQ